MRKKKKIKEGVIASYSILINNKGELISEVSSLPENKKDIISETFKRSEEVPLPSVLILLIKTKT